MRYMITYFPQTFSAIFLINFSFSHCWSTVNMFPFSLDENPHCGLRHNLSRDMNSDALLILAITSSSSSSSPLYEVISPRTTFLSPETYFKGSNPPALFVSYSK